MTVNRQNVFMIILVLALIGGAYFLFQRYFPPPQDEFGYKEEFSALLRELSLVRSVNLDTEILQNEEFRRLVVPALPPFPDIKPGRRNPFIPF